MHIILDIDGTLVGSDKEFNIYPRPHIKEFLNYCFKEFDSVSIWTAASKDWADRVLNTVAPKRTFRFVWSEDRCTYRSDRNKIYQGDFFAFPIVIKPLKKVWRKYDDMTRDNTIIVDDTPNTYKDNYGNAIPITTYKHEDDKNDDELLKLIQFLKTIKESRHHLRFIEKRKYIDS